MKRRVECQRPKLHLSILYLLVLAVLPATARGETLAALLDRAVSPQADFAEFPNLVASYLGTEEQAFAAAREQLQAGPSTNQQTGSPATSSGTTNLVDKT